MPLILLALLVFVLLAFTGVILLSIALRYRAGAARRQGRRWTAVMNFWATCFSAFLFLFFTFLSSFWLGHTLRFAIAGMGIGALLGLLGLALTRWEVESEGIFYTPSRALALLITLAIAGRLAYGWWRGFHSQARTDQNWLTSLSGTQLSFAVAGALIGYYLIYAIGVRARVLRHEKRRRSG